MALHPNWKALATVDFPWKQFVREGSSDTRESTNTKKIINNLLNGEEAKRIYEEEVGSDLSYRDNPVTSTAQDKHTNTHGSRSRNNSQILSKNHNQTKWINSVMAEAQKNNVIALTALFADSCNVDVRDQYGWTPLMSAACAGALDVVKFLIEHRADVNLKDKSGNTCLSLARRNGHLEVVQAITESKSGRRKEDTGTKHMNKDAGEFYCDICKQNFHRSWRKHVTSTVHLLSSHPKSSIPTVYGIPATNKGYQMLVKRGWDREKGLGPTGSGNKFPLKTVLKQDREGLGGQQKNKARVTHSQPVETSKRTLGRRNREAAQQRERRRERALRRELGDMS
ncbi:G patch domain and ankyrin repeat-containing protein 1 homolog [Periplaneta americana]|uniref:G patch domain and ankyrin repeat-containing protein 1 homolog n=1 Tax=Periplaneta americana TaxID=6978 RepID=UPI0037E7CBB4